MAETAVNLQLLSKSLARESLRRYKNRPELRATSLGNDYLLFLTFPTLRGLRLGPRVFLFIPRLALRCRSKKKPSVVDPLTPQSLHDVGHRLHLAFRDLLVTESQDIQKRHRLLGLLVSRYV